MDLELHSASLVFSSVILVTLLLYTSVFLFVKEQSQLLNGGVLRINEAMPEEQSKGSERVTIIMSFRERSGFTGRAFGLCSPPIPRGALGAMGAPFMKLLSPGDGVYLHVRLPHNT